MRILVKNMFFRHANSCMKQAFRPLSFGNFENGLQFPYHRITGKNPGVIYCTGLGTGPWDSNFPLRLQKHVSDFSGHGFFRFQYRFMEDQRKVWHVNNWVEDIVTICNFLDETEGPGKRIIIGASAGAQAVVRAAIKIPEKVHSLLLLSPGLALDMGYMERIYPGSYEKLKAGEKLAHPTLPGGISALVDYDCLQKEYGDEDPIRVYKYPEPIPISCPVRILHGMDDYLVPFKNSLDYAKRLASEDVEVTVLKGRGHVLEDCPQVFTALDKLMETGIEIQAKEGKHIEAGSGILGKISEILPGKNRD